MTNVVSFLKQQFAKSLALPWQELLDDAQLEQVLDKHKAKAKRERVFYALGHLLLLALASPQCGQKL